MQIKLEPLQRFSGSVTVPGDKSISHRALILGSIAQGETRISNLLESGDVRSTEECLLRLGIEIFRKSSTVLIRGRGLHGLKAPSEVLDCGNSGTTLRLLMGLLSGQPFKSTLTGDESLRCRPMKRIADPLREMGAKICLSGNEFAPLEIQGATLKGLDFQLSIASAQLKTALLLAGLSAEGVTRLRSKIGSRDHTERMLPMFGVQLDYLKKNLCSNDSPDSIDSTVELSIRGGSPLFGTELKVPGDPSSAAFWMAGACLVPKGRVEIKNVLINPTRIGFVNVLKRMGAKISITMTSNEFEPVGDILVSHSRLIGVQVKNEEISSLIDELPLLGVLATQAHGVTEVRGAEELRVKECDRIEALATNLRSMGVVIETYPDGFRIEGPQKLKGAKIQSFSDHRIAMSFAIASCIADGETVIEGTECVQISYPGFFDRLASL